MTQFGCKKFRSGSSKTVNKTDQVVLCSVYPELFTKKYNYYRGERKQENTTRFFPVAALAYVGDIVIYLFQEGEHHQRIFSPLKILLPLRKRYIFVLGDFCMRSGLVKVWGK